MNVLNARDIRRLLLWRAHHQDKSLQTYHRIDSHKSGFKQSLLSNELSDGRWCSMDTKEVPRGFLPVYVGSEQRRFVIPMACLSMPDFRTLMERAEDEFGFEQEGGLKIPCEEEDFEEILFKCMAKHRSSKTRKRK